MSCISHFRNLLKSIIYFTGSGPSRDELSFFLFKKLLIRLFSKLVKGEVLIEGYFVFEYSFISNGVVNMSVEKFPPTILVDSLIRQFSKSWQMLEHGLNNVAQATFHKWEYEWSFVSTCVHIIETGEFYNQSTPDGFMWGSIIGVDWKEDRQEVIREKYGKVSKLFLTEQIRRVKKSIEEQLSDIGDEGLLGRDGFAEWQHSILDKYLYLLRHNMHHIGEINKVLRDQQEKRINWS